MTRAASTAPPRPVELPLSPVPAAIREAYGRPRGRCPRPDLRVAVWLWPLLDRTVTALMDELEALPLRANDLEAQLVEALPWHQLVMMADRTLLLHMHIEGLFGRLDGPTPAARAASFLAGLEEPASALEVYGRWPVLGTALVEVLDGWRRHMAELLTRLVTDLPAISRHIAASEVGPLTGIEAGMGDPHRGQRSVVILGFDGGFRLVYKPRSLALDQAFDALQRWVVGHTSAPPARPRRQLVREDYGWERFVPHAGCDDADAVGLYFRRVGHLAAMFVVLDGADLHFENIRAWGDTPVAIDPECLFQPRAYVHIGPDGEPVAPADNFHSVLNTGLVPVGIDKDLDGAAIDVSGLSQGLSARLAAWEVDEEGTDAAHMVRRAVDAELRGANLPLLDGAPVDPADHEEDFLRGFQEALGAVQEHREAFGERVEAFAGLASRVLMRDTQTYAELLEASFHPDYLRDADARGAMLAEQLGREVSDRPHLAPFVSMEVADLLRVDIPVFVSRPDARHVDGSDGTRVEDANPYTALDVLRARLALRSDALASETFAIRSSFALSRLERAEGGGSMGWSASAAPERQAVEAALRSVLDQLVRWASVGERYAFWTGLRRRSSRWSAFVLGMGLQSGSVGIGLVLQEAGRCLNHEGYGRIGRMGVRTGALAGARELAPVRPVRVELGFRWGWGGTLFGLARSLRSTGDPWLAACLPPIAAHLAERVVRSPTARFHHGFGGALLGLEALHEVLPLDEDLMARVRARESDLPRAERPARAMAPVHRGGPAHGGDGHGALRGGLAGLVLDGLDAGRSWNDPQLAGPLAALVASVEAGDVPCANPLGLPTPDLESGYAGIALALLRVLDPTVPALHRGVLA